MSGIKSSWGKIDSICPNSSSFIYDTLSPFRRANPANISTTVRAQNCAPKVNVPFVGFDQEELWVLLLDANLQITHEVMVYRGTISTPLIRQAELLKEAVSLSHCHPSGDPTPSPEDVRMTRQVNEAADLLGLDLADHIIVGQDRWVSLKERGLGFG
ncbi:MAG: JAB domain-containing protein [Planctomycetes bacterium]|nr:JAB domain-containing protein [Planctomycetota bacterium]